MIRSKSTLPTLFIVQVFLFLFSSCGEISPEEKDKLVNGFINYYNKIPDQIYLCDEGYLLSAQQTEPYKYEIEVSIKTSEFRDIDNVKYFKCTSTVAGSDGGPVTVLNHHCIEEQGTGERGGNVEEEVVTESETETGPVKETRGPIELDNEVQLNTAVTSGEQFVAVPREDIRPKCVDCSSHVNPQAHGVDELANIGIRQLNSLEPQIKHSLNTVIDVERQSQVVNGIRYIIILLVNYDSCTVNNQESCSIVKPCKFSILEKPWLKLHDGSKYRAIISNNCTKIWQFGDDGVVVTDQGNNQHVTGETGEDTIEAVNVVALKSEKTTSKTLTQDDVKNIEEQIIPNNKIPPSSPSPPTQHSDDVVGNKEHVVKEEVPISTSANTIEVIPQKIEHLSDDKKKAIDELLNFFSFSGIDSAPNPNDGDNKSRMKRSFRTDINVMQLAEKYYKLKQNLENAKQVYRIAQFVVDNQNEMDMEVKNRVLKEVINAEEETDNHQHYYYIQYLMEIPCNRFDCEDKGTVSKICNAVIDGSSKIINILTVFCHDGEKRKSFGIAKNVPLDDPVLLHLVKEAHSKIESESSRKALKLNSIIDAYTQLLSGTITKVSVIFDYTDCDISVPVYARENCSVKEELGFKICSIIIHERHWLKEKKITYECHDKKADISFSDSQKNVFNKSVDDPAVFDMVQEAIQHLETQSVRNNKQILININSVSTKLVSGFLTDIEFVVGYTTCTIDVRNDDMGKCKLLQEPLRKCKAKVWDRTWIETGRQVDVSCLDQENNVDEGLRIRKRSLLSISEENDDIDKDVDQNVDASKVGGPVEQDVNDPKFKALAEESMVKFLQNIGNPHTHRLVSIEKVTVQVVAGTSTIIHFTITPDTETVGDKIKCTSKIFEQLWNNIKDISVSCHIVDEKRQKRQINVENNLMTGGALERDPNDSRYKKLAEESLSKYLELSGVSQPHSVVAVKKVTTQVVSGSLTRIEFTIAPDDGSNNKKFECKSEIWEQPWLDKNEIKVECGDDKSEIRAKRHAVGGEIEKDPNDPKYKQLAEESMRQYLQVSGVSQPHSVVAVKKVTIQVVSGSLTRIEFTIAPDEGSTNEKFECKSEIWEQPWLDKKEIKVECGDVKLQSRHKRHITRSSPWIGPEKVGAQMKRDHAVDDFIEEHSRDENERFRLNWAGGQEERDPNDPKYKQLAEESMRQYLQVSGVSQPHSVVAVKKVTIQVVSGSLTRIEFTIAPDQASNNEKFECKSEIWEQPWLDKKEIKVACGDDKSEIRAKTHYFGGQTEKDPNDPKYKQLAEESMRQYLQVSGVSQPHSVVAVKKVTIQVVSGLLTRMEFTIAPDQASNNEKFECKSEIWEQPWLDKKEIKVACGDDKFEIRAKRQTVGGETEKDPNDPKYKQLAEESMRQYLQVSGVSQPHSVVAVKKVTSQVVSGSLTRIEFTIAPDEGSTNEKFECKSEIWEQPWLDKKEIKVECGDVKLQSRHKRHITRSSPWIGPEKVGAQMKRDHAVDDFIEEHSRDENERFRLNWAGGQEERDPNDPKYKQLAEESMRQYLQVSGVSQPHSVVAVKKVTIQVVSGSLTRIEFTIAPDQASNNEKFECKSEIWEQPWLDKKEIKVACGDDKSEIRAKTHYFGGQTEKDPNDPKYKQLAEESMRQYLQVSGVSQPHSVVAVKKVTIQVVSGLLTRMEFTIAPDQASNNEKFECKSEIWEQPWLDKKEIKVACGDDKSEIRAKTHYFGGQTEKDPNDPKYKQLAEESMRQYLQVSGVSQPHSVVAVKKVTIQVVSGLLTRMEFTIAPDQASNNEKFECKSEIWEQPWLDKKEIKVACGDYKSEIRAKTHYFGGQTEKDPNDPKYKQLAEESMRQYLQVSGVSQPHSVVAVKKVTIQVVSGLLTRMEFTIAPDQASNNEKFECKSEIWEQPWLDKKEIKVACGDYKSEIRAKRQTVGGETEKDPNDPKYKQLAEESMRQYLQVSGVSQPHSVVAVKKVTTQVVSGSLTRIEFTIAPDEGSNNEKFECKSEIWEQPWLDKKEIKVACGDYKSEIRAKRQTVGGETEKDPNDPKYKQLAEESMRQYLQVSGVSRPHSVVAVKKVTIQVVSGSLTRIEFTIAPDEGSINEKFECKSEIWEQTWLGKKEIKVECGDVKLQSRHKRHVTRSSPWIGLEKVGAQMKRDHAVDDFIEEHSRDENKRLRLNWAGGQEERDPNDPKYKQLAEESMRQYLQVSGVSQPHSVVAVKKVTIQVVSGSLTRIEFTIAPEGSINEKFECKSEIWEQPWLDKKEIKVACGDYKSEIRAKTHYFGGQTEKDPNDPKYKQLAEESMRQYLQVSGVSQPHSVVAVKKVTIQVVSGLLTRMEFTIAPDQASNNEKFECKSEIWEQPWLDKKEIKVACGDDKSEIRAKTHYFGGQTEKDPNDPKYKQLAEESMRQYLQVSGVSQPHSVVAVKKVTIQVVSGLLTRMEFTIAPDQASNNEKFECKSEIWEQPWLDKKEIKVACGDDKFEIRAKRQTVGGETEKDPNDPKYKQLAEESMRQYLQVSGVSQPHSVVAVKKVTSQVVSGSLTRIEFTIAPDQASNNEKFECKSEIWEQPWLDKKEIKVECGDVKLQSRHKRHLLSVDGHPSINEIVYNTRNIVGGPIVHDPNDTKIKQLTEESMQKFLQDAEISQPHKVLDIENATSQVVSGTLYVIHFRIGPDSGKPGNVRICHSSILEQSWVSAKDINVKCEYKNKISKREVLRRLNVRSARKQVHGSVTEQDPTKPEYRELAKKSLENYLKLNDIKKRHKIIEVEKVTSQVVSGVIYHVYFSAGPSDCVDDCEETSKLLCHSEILSQPWLGSDDIKVSCRNKKKKRITRSLKTNNLVDTNDITENEERGKRQADEDDYIDDEMKFYYAERAIKQLNQKTTSNNLLKLVSIHAVQNSMHMGNLMVRMYIEVAETYCIRRRDENFLPNCEELEGLNHKLCHVRLWPDMEDELVVLSISVICDDDPQFETITGISIPALLRASLFALERSPDIYYKLVHQGEPQIIPSLDSNVPIAMNFLVAVTNCTKDTVLKPNVYDCFIDVSKSSKACQSFIWMKPNSIHIDKVTATCHKPVARKKRSVSMNPTNATADELIIQNLVKESVQKLEMQSANRYKQRVLKINSYSMKVTSGKVTTIDFDVGFTTCLKYEWVKNEKSCEFIEHLPRRHCVSQVWERLWIDNGKRIEVSCEDEEFAMETHVEFENIEIAKGLAEEAVKHIEAKYPAVNKQQAVRIFSLEKQAIAGIHYRLKLEVGDTNCTALSNEKYCKVKTDSVNKFCRVNIWLRPWTDHPPNYRVTCDYQESNTGEFFHHVQAEQLFSRFMATHKPEYINDHKEMLRRFQIFKKNVRKIHEFNTHERGTAVYGVTRFADLTYEEFSTKYMGLKPELRNPNDVPMRQAQIPKIAVPDKFDWREYGAVTEVKNQGSCGSCWAFSVTGNIEGQWKMHTGDLVSLSEQELVDCDKLDNGCEGGLPDNAYRAIEQLGGLETENDYPYEGENDKCSFNKTLSKVTISGAVNITSNETDMAKWLVTHGPISIGINANAMQFYMGGVSHPWKMLCDPKNLDHGVLIVGYGVKDYPLFHKTLPYWTIKNSWGEAWGERGYYRVFRGDGTCGVNRMASSALL